MRRPVKPIARTPLPAQEKTEFLTLFGLSALPKFTKEFS